MFTYRFHSVSASILLSLAALLESTMPAAAQGRGANSQTPSTPSYQQQLQQQLQKDQQFLQQQEQWFQQMQKQQLWQQQMMQNWYQQQMSQQQMMQRWQVQGNSPAFSQRTPAAQIRRSR